MTSVPLIFVSYSFETGQMRILYVQYGVVVFFWELLT